ncbi:MAG: secretin N-terminal domain-containing protein [Planctomycetota bacterium]
MRLPRLFPLFVVLALSAVVAVGEQTQAGEAVPPVTITLPANSELDKLAELTAQFTGVSLQYNPQKIRGSVRLAIRGQLSKAELWDVFNQVLMSQGFTTVVSGLPAVYQVVPISEAPGLSVVMSKEDVAQLPFLPGYAVEVIELKSLGAEPTVKALGALFSNQVCQVRTLGPEQNKVVIAAPQSRIQEARSLLERLDRPGVVPVVRLFRPQRSGPQNIQTAATAAWAALSRVSTQPRLAEIQVAPDGAQVVLISNGENIEQLVELVKNLDDSEPIETRTYRPRFFGIDEVGSLVQRLLHSDQSTLPNGGVDIVRDNLTGSLIIKATVAQHKRIDEVLKTLDDAPANARRQIRSFTVKHRQADEVAKLIGGLRSAGSMPTANGIDGLVTAGNESGTTQPSTNQPATNTSGQPAAPTTTGTGTTSRQPSGGTQGQGGSGNRDNDFVMSADMVTNKLIVMGDPRVLDQVQALLEQIDQRQPQVELEVILLTLSSSQNLDLGVELVSMIQQNQISGGISSLFGLSQATGGPTMRSFGSGGPTGLGGILIQPGDFAGVLTALEKVTDARSIIRSRVVANNNAKSTIDGVVQQPLTSNNASSTVSTTSVTGTTDAGTQISITPQISVADYVTITYTISQSTFLGNALTTANGTVIPPAKRADNITSVATIPDGFVIGLGGLSNRSESHGESRIPLLGKIPLLGNLFKSSSDTSSDSRFFVFIRANVLRNDSFEDLRYLSGKRAREAELKETDWPVLKPELMK